MINIYIVSVKRLPGTESPEGEVKLKKAESFLFFRKKYFLSRFLRSPQSQPSCWSSLSASPSPQSAIKIKVERDQIMATLTSLLIFFMKVKV